jgi:hypothetical protein
VLDSAWGFAPASAWGVKAAAAARTVAVKVAGFASSAAGKAKAGATWINESLGYLGGRHPLWPADNLVYPNELLKAQHPHLRAHKGHEIDQDPSMMFLWKGKDEKKVA